MNTIEEKADFIINLYKKFGDEDYIGEPVSQIEHMTQCATLAINSGWDDEMVLAAFFHDIGHLYEHIAPEKVQHMDGFGIVDHEGLGAAFLKELGFSERIQKLVASHVNAKRYMVSMDENYFNNLSEASKETLKHQGGRMSNEEILDFESDNLFEEYIQLRRWDELAKEENIAIPNLEIFRNKIIDHLNTQANAN